MSTSLPQLIPASQRISCSDFLPVARAACGQASDERLVLQCSATQSVASVLLCATSPSRSSRKAGATRLLRHWSRVVGILAAPMPDAIAPIDYRQLTTRLRRKTPNLLAEQLPASRGPTVACPSSRRVGPSSAPLETLSSLRAINISAGFFCARARRPRSCCDVKLGLPAAVSCTLSVAGALYTSLQPGESTLKSHDLHPAGSCVRCVETRRL